MLLQLVLKSVFRAQLAILLDAIARFNKIRISISSFGFALPGQNDWHSFSIDKQDNLLTEVCDYFCDYGHHYNITYQLFNEVEVNRRSVNTHRFHGH